MRYSASHSVVCNAPTARVYDLIRRTSEWPQILEPCEAVTVLQSDRHSEHVEIVARLQGVRMTWESRRTFRPEVNGVDAQIVRPMPLVADMRTSWRVISLNDQQCVLLLEHDYSLRDDITGVVPGVGTKAEAERFIADSIDANSSRELADLKKAAERAPADAGLDRSLRHSIVCAAPADEVYAIIRDTGSWPLIFDACVAATRIDGDDTCELVRIEAIQNGAPVSWQTRRRYDHAIRRIDYELPVPMPFLESMSGEWRVIPLGAKRCLLTVDRRWRLLAEVDGIRPGVTSIEQAASIVEAFVDGNAESEMLAIRAFVEEGTNAFTTVIQRFAVPYAPDDVVAALLPAVGARDLMTGETAQLLRYRDAEHQECVHRPLQPLDEAVRVVRHLDEQALAITFCQPVPPPGLRQRYGRCEVRAAGGGSDIVVRQSARLDVERLASLLGIGELPEQKRRVRELLEKDSNLTVDACVQVLAGVSPTGVAPAPDVDVAAWEPARV